jgi:hypothetical protein
VIRVLAWVAALAVALAVVAALAPASLVARLIDERTQGRVHLAEPHGSLWNGSGTLVTHGGRAGVPVAWTLDAVPLLAGEARIALRRSAAPYGVDGVVVLGRARLAAEKLDATWPAEGLPLPIGTLAGGEVRWTATGLAAGTDPTQGDVRIEWQRARLALPGVDALDLGTVTATLASDGKRWRGPVRARGGMVVVDGEAALAQDGADLALTLVPQPGMPAALRARLGPGDADGAVRVRLAPRFR